MARRVDDREAPFTQPEPDAGGVDGDGLIAFVLQRVERERPFGLQPAAAAARHDLLDAGRRQRARVVQQPPDQRGLPVIDVTEHDDARVPLHMYPPVRSRSNDASLSWSMVRPARSGSRVVASSSMISSIVAALLAIGTVMFFSPSDRYRIPSRAR